MFERLILCEYAVAILVLRTPRVYELGVRHAVRPYSTVLVYAATEAGSPSMLLRSAPFPYETESTAAPPPPTPHAGRSRPAPRCQG